MPRVTWSRLVIVLVALPLASCFQDVGDCPTCPPENSGRIDVLVPQAGLVDSAHVALDGGSQVTVRRNRRHAFENLSRGTHELAITRYFSIDGVFSARSSSLRIRLDRGEARTLVFHNDFPLVAWTPAPGTRHAGTSRAVGPTAPRRG